MQVIDYQEPIFAIFKLHGFFIILLNQIEDPIRHCMNLYRDTLAISVILTCTFTGCVSHYNKSGNDHVIVACLRTSNEAALNELNKTLVKKNIPVWLDGSMNYDVLVSRRNASSAISILKTNSLVSKHLLVVYELPREP